MPLPIRINSGDGLGLSGTVNSMAILSKDMTQYDVKQLRDSVGDRLLAVAQAKSIGHGPGEITIRDASYNTDLGGAANDWVTAAATVAATQYTFVNSALAANKAVAVYGFWSRDAVPNIVRVRLQSTGGGTTYQDIDVSAIYSCLEQVCYFSTPIFYGPTNTVFVQLFPRIAAVSISGLLALVAEPQGEYLSRSVV